MRLKIKYVLEGRSPRWYEVRKNYIKYNPSCAACETTANIEVHHIQPFEIFPDLELDPQNLMTLCRYCHLVIGHYKDFSLYNPYALLDAMSYKYNKATNSKKI